MQTIFISKKKENADLVKELERETEREKQETNLKRRKSCEVLEAENIQIIKKSMMKQWKAFPK